MLEWFKQFFIIPMSYLAAAASILFIAVEILTLTTWGLIKRGHVAARAYHKLIRPQKYNPLTDYKVWAGIAIGIGVTYYYVRSKRNAR